MFGYFGASNTFKKHNYLVCNNYGVEDIDKLQLIWHIWLQVWM